MRNIIKATFYAGVGIVDKLREEVDELVRRGELKKNEAQELVEVAERESKHRMKHLHDKVESTVRKAIDKLPIIAVRKDVEALEARVAELETQLTTLTERINERETVPFE